MTEAELFSWFVRWQCGMGRRIDTLAGLPTKSRGGLDHHVGDDGPGVGLPRPAAAGAGWDRGRGGGYVEQVGEVVLAWGRVSPRSSCRRRRRLTQSAVPAGTIHSHDWPVTEATRSKSPS